MDKIVFPEQESLCVILTLPGREEIICSRRQRYVVGEELNPWQGQRDASLCFSCVLQFAFSKGLSSSMRSLRESYTKAAQIPATKMDAPLPPPSPPLSLSSHWLPLSLTFSPFPSLFINSLSFTASLSPVSLPVCLLINFCLSTLLCLSLSGLIFFSFIL